MKSVNEQITFNIEQNLTNPFNPETEIRFSLESANHTTLTVYNTLGQIMEVLIDRKMSAGYHSIHFYG